MLYKETVSPQLIELLLQLQSFESLKKFRLVGGTALALQIGHRKSIDIDLFSDRSFDKEDVKADFFQKFSAKKPVAEMTFGLSYIINDVKIDILNWGVPYLRPAKIVEGIRMASTEDISAFKLHAIEERGTKKDYWDLAHLLDKHSLQDMISFYKAKYSEQDSKSLMSRILKFERTGDDPDPFVLNSMTWDHVKQKITVSVDALVQVERQVNSDELKNSRSNLNEQSDI